MDGLGEPSALLHFASQWAHPWAHPVRILGTMIRKYRDEDTSFLKVKWKDESPALVQCV